MITAKEANQMTVDNYEKILNNVLGNIEEKIKEASNNARASIRVDVSNYDSSIIAGLFETLAENGFNVHQPTYGFLVIDW